MFMTNMPNIQKKRIRKQKNAFLIARVSNLKKVIPQIVGKPHLLNYQKWTIQLIDTKYKHHNLRLLSFKTGIKKQIL